MFIARSMSYNTNTFICFCIPGNSGIRITINANDIQTSSGKHLPNYLDILTFVLEFRLEIIDDDDLFFTGGYNNL